MADFPEEDVSETVADALSAFMAEHGCVLEAFVGMADYIDSEGKRCWVVMSGPGPGVYNSTGFSMSAMLHEVYRIGMNDDVARYMDDG